MVLPIWCIFSLCFASLMCCRHKTCHFSIYAGTMHACTFASSTIGLGLFVSVCWCASTGGSWHLRQILWADPGCVPCMQIFIREKKVKVKRMTSLLRDKIQETYRPQSNPEFRCDIEMGFNTENENLYGMMLYHRNRLIRPYHRSSNCLLSPSAHAQPPLPSPGPAKPSATM